MAAQSKENWLKKEIFKALNWMSRHGKELFMFLSKRKTSIRAIVLALTGSLICYKIYQHIQPKAPKYTETESKSNEKEKKPGEQRYRSKLDMAFLYRFVYLVRIAVPKLASKEFFTCIAIALLVIAQSVLISLSNTVSGDLTIELASRNMFNVLKHLAKLVVVLSFNSFVTPTIDYLIGMLHLSMRKNLTMTIHKLYYRNMIYYKAQNLDKRLGNADQRITQDVDILCKQITSLFLDLLSPLVDVILYSYHITNIMGIIGPLSIFIYMGIAFSVLSLVTPNFTRMSAEVQHREGEFRHMHARIRLNAESIAFYGGDERERSFIEKSFKRLTDYSATVIRKNFIFGVVNDYFTKYAPYSVMTIVGGMPFFYGKMKSLPRQEVMGVLRYLLTAVAYEFFAVGKLIELFRKLLKLSGYTHRVYLLFEVMESLESQELKKSTKIKGQMKDSDEIRFEDVSIYTPLEILLAKHLTFDVRKGRNLIITGPNGCGKSSLFRVLGGLWPLYKGTIYKPGSIKDGLSRDIFYLPQKPYNVIGSLRDQIIYPSTKSKMTDAELQELLDMFGIGYLSKRHAEGFDGCQDWDKLSRGEQQRLAMARLFYHKPSYAILDECTSCINKDAEADLYRNCALHNITCITISHRPALERFHDCKLVFNGSGGWSFFKKSKDNHWYQEKSFAIDDFRRTRELPKATS